MIKRKTIWILLSVATLFAKSVAIAQSLETYAGHKRAGFDLMWFKNFKNTKEEQTPFLFFSRNRASTDYENSPTGFASTNAISYNFKNGIGIVAVGSFLNTGFTPKAGVQLYRQNGNMMFFGWLVADLKHQGSIDLFGLFRYQPKLNERWRFFSQVEVFPVYTPSGENWNITQRLRLGAKYYHWAAGPMADFNQSGNQSFTTTQNIGGFLRYEF